MTLNLWRDAFGRISSATPLPACPNCGGRLRVEEDTYWVEAACWNCERVYAHTPIPRIEEIEEDEWH